MKNHQDNMEEVEIDVLQHHNNHPALSNNGEMSPQLRNPYDDANRNPYENPGPVRPIRPLPHAYEMPAWSNSTQTLNMVGTGTPTGSRPASPPWGESQSGRGTPLSHMGMPRNHSYLDSRPNSFAHQSHASLTHLLPGSPTPVFAKEVIEGGQIARLHERDDSDIWNGWKRKVYYMIPFLTLLNTLMYLVYYGLRIACVIFAQRASDMVYTQAWVFVAIEFFVALPPLMHNTWTMWAIKSRGRPKLRLVGDDVPSVDVFVTCCGEDDDLVMDTVRAACNLDYPMDRFRVIILDDGKSSGLEELATHMAKFCPNLYYIARPKFPGVPHHFKAGNLNYGLEAVHQLPGGAGKFMAALDADMIPESAWLRAILPHMVRDPKVALACPPQLFYNTPAADPLAQSLDFFVHVIEPIKDALGVAWCTGSGYVVRRDALDEIGNFPLDSLAEDVATSTMLLGRGWKTAYIHEPLQFGTVPEDFGGHLKQRTRWAIGTVDTSFKLKFCLWGDKVKHMTFPQRFSGFLYASLNLYTILLSASLFAIPIILVMGKPLVAYATEDQLRWLIRACFGATVTNRLCEFVLSMPAGYRTGRRGARYEMWMSPFIALSIVRSFILPKWLGGQTQAFKPTGSLGSELNERDAKTRKNMVRRLWAILVNFFCLYHLAFVYLTLVAVVLTSFRCFAREDNTKDLLFCLLTHAFWPPLVFVFICSSLWTPIAYAIDPPTMPPREQLLDRDPKTGIAHPKPESKKIAFSGEDAWFEFEYTFTTLYTGLIFVLSFIY